MAGYGLAALAAVVLVVSFSVADARYVVVGDTANEQEPWTQIGINYTVWEQDNPLYVGDVAVFKYRAYYHVVWALPDQNDFDNCIYDRADFIGNDTAGIGDGFFVSVTAQPQYLACGVFGHCEIGQKVIINGTAGPLPPALIGVDVPPPAPPAPPYVPPPPVVTLPPLILAFPPYEASSPPPPGISLVSPPPVAGPPVAAVVDSPPPPAAGAATSLAPTIASAVLLGAAAFLLL